VRGTFRTRLGRAAIPSICVATAIVVLPTIPAHASQTAAPAPIASVDPASLSYASPPGPVALTDAQHQPVVDLSELEGLWPSDAVQVLPFDTSGAVSPRDAIDGATPVLADGSATTDVYGTGPNDASHLALVYPDVVNAENANGDWKDVSMKLIASDRGWTYTDLAGYAHTLPSVLSETTPVELTTPSGSLAFAPVGVKATGALDGDTVTYAGASGGGDLIYQAGSDGLAEQITLPDVPADPSFTYSITTDGLSLIANPYGGLDVRNGDGTLVAWLPAPVVYDASPERADSVGAYTLTETGKGTYSLSVTFDTGWFAQAKYPVVVDPAQVFSTSASRDGYTNSASPSTSYESNSFLQVDSGKRTYVKTNDTSINGYGAVVYAADLFLYPTATGSVTGGIDAKRVIDDWPASGTLNWNNQPSLGMSYDNKTQAVQSGQNAGWWDWDVKVLYQHYIDLSSAYETHYTDNGVSLTASNPKTFYSIDSAFADPTIVIVYNDPPDPPALDEPGGNSTVETLSPTLKVNNLPNDPNGDDVYVSFQISDDGANWTGNHLLFQSPWDDKKSVRVPGGILADGQQYWWRAESWDVCGPGRNDMCSLTDGTGTVRDNPHSSDRTFTVSLKHYGEDDRWAMWSHDVGNGMTLEVNQANGNLYLNDPLSSFVTPIGDLDVSLSYNSQLSTDVGLTPGWDVGVGPESARSKLPLSLTQVGSDADSDVKITFRGGRTLIFPNDGGDVWTSAEAGAGRVVQNGDGTWLYVDTDGSRFSFNANGNISSIKLASSAPGTNKHYTYGYSNGHLASVTDPLGRTVNLSWSGGFLISITATNFGGSAWTLGYNQVQTHLTSVSVSVTNNSVSPSQNRNEVETFGYSNNMLQNVMDGVQSAHAGSGWQIGYWTDPKGTVRVQTVTAPGSGQPTPSTTPTPWVFNYFGPYKGTTAAGACVTDPRGTTSTPAPTDCTTTTTNQTQTEFNWAGLPIRTLSPPDQAGYRHDATYVFDGNNNMVCQRSPQANAIAEHCITLANGTVDDDPDGLSTVYTYDGKAPYRLLSVKRPAPAVGAPRLKQTYTYDGEASFQGMWVEGYPNANMTGDPDMEVAWTTMDKDWGAGKPSQITGGNDNWSTRMRGNLDITGMGGQKFKFRVFAADGVNLVVDGKQLLSCFGTEKSAADYNCGTNQDVSKTVWGDRIPIEIDYSALTGNASFTLKWDHGNGNWTVVGSALSPELGIMTSKLTQQVGSGTTDLTNQSWTFPTDDDKARRLPEHMILADQAPSGRSYTTNYAYGALYGELTSESDFVGTPQAATTQHTWQNVGGAWCETSTVDPVGATTTRTCDAAGRVTNQTLDVPAVTGTDQVHQTRVTLTDYDTVGRVTKVEQRNGAGTTLAKTVDTYDESGRLLTKTVSIDTTPTTAMTSYTYDHAGRLRQETEPDPDGGGSLPSPTIKHEYDWADEEIKTTDPNGGVWQTSYDALGRVVTTTSPLLAVTSTTYQLGPSANCTVVDSPAQTASPHVGLSTTTCDDVLDRPTSQQIESYQATTFAYDVLGNETSVVDPAGIRTDSTYDNLSELTKKTAFAQSASPADTTYTLDGAGRVQEVNGPLTADDDRIDYTYDLDGRITKAEYQGVTLPSAPTKVSASFVYNNAGEMIKVSQPLSTSTTMDRKYTFDEAGRPATYHDAKGTTNYTTNLAGWVTQVSDPRPQTIYFGYDNLGRRVCRYTSSCTGPPSSAETYAYDAAGNMTLAKNPTAAFSMDYDADGRLAHVWPNATKTNPAQTIYTYDATHAQLTSIADAAGTTAFTYNAANQIQTLDDPLVTGANLSTYGYSATSGKMASRTDAQANLRWDLAYEAATGRLDTETIKNNTTQAQLASFDLGYDPASNVTSKVSTVGSNASNATWTYDYDGASRMLQAVGKNAAGAATTWDYAYDGAGDRTRIKQTTNPSTVVSDLTTTYDSAGYPTTATDATTGESISYTHDNIGDLTKIDSSINSNDWAFTFDAYSRTTCAQQATTCTSGTRVLPTYDALDRMVSRVYGSATTNYTYQGLSETLAKAVTGSTTTTYAHTGSGGPLGEKTGSTVSYDLLDPHGDLVGLVSTGAASQGTTAYDAWGKPLATSGTQSALGYQGDWTDSVTRFVDMGTRLYGPSLGRFSSRDVLFGDSDDPMSLNQFAYGEMSPIAHWDPTGTCAIIDGQPEPCGNTFPNQQGGYTTHTPGGGTVVTDSSGTVVRSTPNQVPIEPPTLAVPDTSTTTAPSTKAGQSTKEFVGDAIFALLTTVGLGALGIAAESGCSYASEGDPIVYAICMGLVVAGALAATAAVACKEALDLGATDDCSINSSKRRGGGAPPPLGAILIPQVNQAHVTNGLGVVQCGGMVWEGCRDSGGPSWTSLSTDLGGQRQVGGWPDSYAVDLGGAWWQAPG